MITIIDYGMGNLGAIHNMFKKIGIQSLISSNQKDILAATKLILPGVGAFDNGMKNLREMNLIDLLNRKVLEERTPILGICLGMQLLTKTSEEGSLPGLGWIDGDTIRFRFNDTDTTMLKIPHMGWNLVEQKKESPLFSNMYDEPCFYFVHSYHVVCRDEDILSKTQYGIDFVSSLQKDTILGVQFHPEKSHKFGMKLFRNFAENVPC